MGNVRHLDRKVKILWFLPTALILGIIILLGPFLFFMLPDASLTFGISKPDLIVLTIAFPIVFGLIIYFWLHVHYLNFTYELGDKELKVREGVITRKTTVIPFERIQDITSERTLGERMLGLATIEIETAGSSKLASSMMIPGIANKDVLISEIMAMVQKARARNGGDAESRHTPTEKLLADILHEIKGLSEKFDIPPKSRADGKGQKGMFEQYADFKAH
ncbi:MAG: PH domain-containing protein [Candidatus Micrarchaeia archaeon]